MSEVNPYSTPTTDPTLDFPVSGQLQLASPGERFGGALIDGLISAAFAFPLSYAAGKMGFIAQGGGMGRGGNFLATAVITILCFVIFIAIQWTFLNATGQTIGKKVLKTRIVTMDGKKPVIGDLIFKRYMFMNLIGIIPWVGSVVAVVDALMVFKADRRCLHDLIAGTQVVRVVPGEVIS